MLNRFKCFQNDYQLDNDLSVERFGEPCTCTDLTVYAECNISDPENGTYTYVGENSNGWSSYESTVDSNYVIFFDTLTNVGYTICILDF